MTNEQLRTLDKLLCSSLEALTDIVLDTQFPAISRRIEQAVISTKNAKRLVAEQLKKRDHDTR